MTDLGFSGQAFGILHMTGYYVLTDGPHLQISEDTRSYRKISEDILRYPKYLKIPDKSLDDHVFSYFSLPLNL